MLIGKKIFYCTVVFLVLLGIFFLRKNKTVVIRSVQDNSKNFLFKNEKKEIDSGDKKKGIERGKTTKNEELKNSKNEVKKNGEDKIISREKNLKKVVVKKRKKEVGEKNIEIRSRLVNWGFTKSNGRKIDTIVLHSSYDALGKNPYDVDGLILEYEQYGVSPHYLVDRNGNIYRLVKDENIAWHAGVSKIPDGRKNVNNFSIGIEIMNTKTDNYTKKQYRAVQKLIDYLKKKYNIKYILGHDEIAPKRKTDPWNFDWKKIKK